MPVIGSRIARSTFAIVLAFALVAACGDDDGGSATDEACDARAALSSELADVRDDLADANLGAAEDSLTEVRSSLDAFVDAVTDLAEQERAELSPYVDQLQTDLGAVGDVGSVDELGAALEAIQADIENLSAATDTGLDC